MAITSTNINPKNDSKYARHRSIWKGRHNQVRDTIASLQGTRGVTVHEYCQTPFSLTQEFLGDWGVVLGAVREPPRKRQILGSWKFSQPTSRLLEGNDSRVTPQWTLPGGA